MKKIIFTMIMVLLCLSLAACGAAPDDEVVSTLPAEDEVTPTPEAEDDPVPPPVLAVVTDAEDDTYFLSGVDAVLAEADYFDVKKQTLDEFTGDEVNVVVAYLTKEDTDVSKLEAAGENGKLVAVYDAAGVNYVSNAVNFSYNSYGAQQKLLDAALNYPLHDTPVRMFGMFTDPASEAAALWAQYYDEGKIFPKATYMENESEQDAQTWLTEKLEKFYPGMLDCIYVENEALAMAAAEVMETLGRDDAEIFVCNGSEAVLKKMQENHYLFGMTVGSNPCYAGAYTASAAIKMWDEETVGGIEFEPHVIYAEEIKDGNDGFFTEEMKTEYPY